MKTEEGVAEFHIRGRIEAKGPGTYAAIVLAIPLLDESEPFRKMQDVCPTRGAAVRRLHELTVAMGAKIRAEGGTILDVVTDD